MWEKERQKHREMEANRETDSYRWRHRKRDPDKQ